VKERRKKEKPCKDYELKNIIVSKAIRCTVLKRKKEKKEEKMR
jgi:hypothetical protein